MLTNAVVIFIIFFCAWVVFVVIDGLNNAAYFKINSVLFQKRLTSLLNTPIHENGDGGSSAPREANWEDVQCLARKSNLSVGEILYNLNHMLSDATASHKEKGKNLRVHYHTLKRIIADCEQSKDFEQLPRNIQAHLKVIKENSQKGNEATFQLLERDILNLQTSNQEAFKRERLKSLTSIVLAIIGVGIGLISLIPPFETAVRSLFGG